MTTTLPVDSATPAAYGRDYHLLQAQKYRNRASNHWKHRIGLAFDLVEKYAIPRLSRPPFEIAVGDIGCSIGTFAIEFAKKGYRCYGIDFDQSALDIALEMCREEGVSVEFICGDIREQHLELPRTDIAVAFDTFEHLRDPDLMVVLTSIRRCLRPRGSLVFHTCPTEFEHVFYGSGSLHSSFLRPFRSLPASVFDGIIKIYARMLDIALLARHGCTHRRLIANSQHCNPLSRKRLEGLLRQAGYDIVYMQTSQLFAYRENVQKLYEKQPISHRNLYGVAVPARNSEAHSECE